jgi:hypothetical protein
MMMTILLWPASQGMAAPRSGLSGAAAISGVVRDAHGTPQMGALVELLRANATIAVAFSDAHGRYILPTVVPGQYQMRATAAFFLPALRSNVHLQGGVQTIVNLTMSAVFDAENWLPTQRRRADEPVDDWKWALRSTADRPLLRLLDPETGVAVSTSSRSERGTQAFSEGRVSVMNGDGSFGDGGLHQALLLNRSMGDGDGAVLRADVGDPASISAPGASIAVTAGFEHHTILGGSTRLVTAMQSHPELTNGSQPGFGPGFEVLQMASTQQLALGDAVLIDAGTLMEAERLEQTRIQTLPYVRVMVRPTDNVMLEYRFAAGRQLQSADDLDRLKPSLTVITDAHGRPLGNKGSHHEVSVSRKLGQTVVSASAFADKVSYASIGGSGQLSRVDLQQTSIVEDPKTGTFQTAAAGFASRGISLSAMRPLTPALSLWAEYDLGTALSGSGFVGQPVPTVTALTQGLKPTLASAGSASIRGKILHTGTSLKAEYRWQPLRTLTQVNAYNATPEEAYLSFYLRQRLWCGRFLPQGVDAVVEATNLLEQGYQPVLAPDGHTLFLAQVPRGIQGGLAFNF